MLDNVADEYRDTTLTVLLRNLSNRQERCSAKLAEIKKKMASSANIKTAKKLQMAIGMKTRKAAVSYVPPMTEECDDAVRRREVSAVARGGGQRSDRQHVKAFLDETC